MTTLEEHGKHLCKKWVVPRVFLSLALSSRLCHSTVFAEQRLPLRAVLCLQQKLLKVSLPKAVPRVPHFPSNVNGTTRGNLARTASAGTIDSSLGGKCNELVLIARIWRLEILTRFGPDSLEVVEYLHNLCMCAAHGNVLGHFNKIEIYFRDGSVSPLVLDKSKRG